MLIRDIRLYHTDMDNVDGYPLPMILDEPALQATATRIAMKLREGGFSLGDYEELKLNYTPCVAKNTVQHAPRTATNRQAHYVDVGVTHEVFRELHEHRGDGVKTVIPGVKQALLILYGRQHEDREQIREAVAAAEEQGEELEVCVMQKSSIFNRAWMYVKYLDSGDYLPRLYVTDRQGRVLLNEQLPMIDSLENLGDVQLGMKKATVHPKYGAQGPMVFNFH